MKLYDQIFNVVKQFRKLFSPGPVTNADVSGSITAEIFIIVSLYHFCLKMSIDFIIKNITNTVKSHVRFFGNVDEKRLKQQNGSNPWWTASVLLFFIRF